MRALVTLQDGQMFRVDTPALSVTAMDRLGKPVSTSALRSIPAAVPSSSFTFTLGNGVEIRKDKVASVIYSR